jgi:adenylate cyclase
VPPGFDGIGASRYGLAPRRIEWRLNPAPGEGRYGTAVMTSEVQPRRRGARAPLSGRAFFWALPASVALGAVFGHVAAPEAGGASYLHGAVAGIFISSAIVAMELLAFNRTRSAFVRRVPFLLYLATRALAYLAAILGGLALTAWLFRAGPSTPLIDRDGVVFSLALGVGFNLIYGVNDLLGPGVLLKFVAGRYHRPRIEERVLLFIDMESSTEIAERLGEAGFLDFLNRFVADVTGPILAQRGEIHKYVGDEIIVTWPLEAGLRDGRCVKACFDAVARLDELADGYVRDFGRRANFRAALHCGSVVVGELGIVKLEIVLLGDTMNTASRVLQACRDTGHRVLASAALMDRLAALPKGIGKRSIGKLQLRGKASEVELYALARA